MLSSSISLKKINKSAQLTLVFGLDAKAGGTSGGAITDKAGGTSNDEAVDKEVVVLNNKEAKQSGRSIYLELRIDNY